MRIFEHPARSQLQQPATTWVRLHIVPQPLMCYAHVDGQARCSLRRPANLSSLFIVAQHGASITNTIWLVGRAHSTSCRLRNNTTNLSESLLEQMLTTSSWGMQRPTLLYNNTYETHKTLSRAGNVSIGSLGKMEDAGSKLSSIPAELVVAVIRFPSISVTNNKVHRRIVCKSVQPKWIHPSTHKFSPTLGDQFRAPQPWKCDWGHQNRRIVNAEETA